MVQKKVADPVRGQQAERRDGRRVAPAGPDGVNPAGNAANPCPVVAVGLNLSPEALRKRFYRATTRISRDLEIDEMDHG